MAEQDNDQKPPAQPPEQEPGGYEGSGRWLPMMVAFTVLAIALLAAW